MPRCPDVIAPYHVCCTLGYVQRKNEKWGKKELYVFFLGGMFPNIYDMSYL